MEDGRLLFGVVVRSIGLLILLWGLENLLVSALALVATGLPQHYFGMVRVLFPLLYVFVGIYLMIRADGIVTFGYGNKSR